MWILSLGIFKFKAVDIFKGRSKYVKDSLNKPLHRGSEYMFRHAENQHSHWI